MKSTVSVRGARRDMSCLLVVALFLIGVLLAATSLAGAGAPMEKVTLRVGRIPQAQGTRDKGTPVNPERAR